MYFVNAFLVMCGVACGMPVLFAANWACRRYFPTDSRYDEYQKRTIELMAERNQLDDRKATALENLSENTMRSRLGAQGL